MTTAAREVALSLVRVERARQIKMYGTNDDLELGFGSTLSYPWLTPYVEEDSGMVETTFRQDYESYEMNHGKPTWMHLIREEVAELFKTRQCEDAVEEAVQVAALCVSLVEKLLDSKGELP